MKKLTVCFAAVILLVFMVACSSSSATKSGVTQQSNDMRTIPATTTTALVTKVPSPTITSAKYSESGVSYSGGLEEITIDRMIVRTGDMTMLVEDISGTIDRIRQLAQQYQGYVVSSQVWKSDERLYGSISIRIPADDYDAILNTISGYAVEVTNLSTSSQDVTEEYTDLSSKLKNLEAAEQQLLQIMQKAVKVEDVLAVQKQLTDVRSQIEQTKGRMQYLERTSATSLINISLQTSKLAVKLTASSSIVRAGEDISFFPEISGGVSPYSYEWNFGDGSTSTEQIGQHQYKTKGTYTISLKVTDDKGSSITEVREQYVKVVSGWDAGNTVRSAWHGLVAFGRILLSVIIWLGIFSPLWLIIGGLVWWQYRRRKKLNK